MPQVFEQSLFLFLSRVGSWRGYFLACALFAVNMVQLLVLQQYWIRCYQVRISFKF